MITRTLAAGTALTALALAAAPAGAQAFEEDTGFYAQGSYTYLDIEPDGADSGVDSSAITGRVGYQFTPTCSVEGDLSTGIDDGEFDFNVDEDDFEFDDNDDGDLDDIIAASGDIGLNYLLGVYGRFSVPVGDRFDVMARGGYAYVDLDAELTTPGGTDIASVEDSADGFSGGVGAAFDLTESIELRGDYTYFDLEDTDTNTFTVAVGYKF